MSLLTEKKLVMGNEAIALGAIEADVQVYTHLSSFQI
jgi:pyruvate/2-oxoacid:ferredoxin oxidoreductase alpha subunit